MKANINTTSVKFNIIFSTCYKVLSTISVLITAPYISRVLGASGVGTYSYINSIASFFLMFGTLGTLIYGSLEIAKVRDDIEERSKVFWEVELLCASVSIVVLAVWIIWTSVWHFGEMNYAFFIATILSGLFDISWFFAGIEYFKYTIIINAIIKILGVSAQLIFVKGPSDLTTYIAIMCLSGLLGSISIWIALPRFIVKVKISDLNLIRHLKGTLLYFIPSIASSVFIYLDKTLIGLITNSAEQNGFYEAASHIVNFTQTIGFAGLNAVLGSRISYLHAKGRIEEIKSRIGKSIDYILFFGIGALFGICAVAKHFVPWFFGAEYAQSVPILVVLSPLVLVIGLSNTLGGQYYNPTGLRAKSAKYIIIGATINCACNLILIPQYGAIGAAIASVIGELVETVLYVTNCGDYFQYSVLLKKGWKKVIAGLLMFGCVYFVGNIVESHLVAVLVQVLIGVTVYGFVLVILNDSFFNIGMLKSSIKTVFGKCSCDR